MRGVRNPDIAALIRAALAALRDDWDAIEADGEFMAVKKRG